MEPIYRVIEHGEPICYCSDRRQAERIASALRATVDDVELPPREELLVQASGYRQGFVEILVDGRPRGYRRSGGKHTAPGPNPGRALHKDLLRGG